MKKFCDIFCLMIWIVQFAFGIMAACGIETISPVAFICATIICIMYYICEIIRDFEI